MRLLLAVVALLVAVPGVTACGRVEEEAAGADVTGRRIRVVATIGMIDDVPERGGGDRVTVSALMGPGVGPHAY